MKTQNHPLRFKNQKGKPDFTASWLWLLVAITAGFWLYISTIHLDNGIANSLYYTRQAQTLISSYWMGVEGISINYPTPTLGEPWMIPMEFPTYQIFVTLLTKTGIPLEMSGRIVSMFFFLACVPMAYWFLRIVSARADVFWIFLILYLSSPIYLYWSGTPMIETTALFLSITYLTLAFYVFKHAEFSKNSAAALLGIFISGTLAILTKATSFPPALFLVSGYGFYLFAAEIWRYLHTRGTKINAPLISNILIVGVMTLLILVIGMKWVHHSDLIKQSSNYTQFLTSEALRSWNWVNMEVIKEPRLYKAIWPRMQLSVLGACYIIGIALIIYAIVFSKSRAPILIALVLFYVPVILFPNLHMRHSYYQMANGFYLIIALSYAISTIKYKAIQMFVISLIVAGNAYTFFNTNIYPSNKAYYGYILSPGKSNDQLAGEWINDNANPDDRLLQMGLGWNTHIHYYAKRKGMTLSHRFYNKTYYKDVVDFKRNNYKWLADCTPDKSGKDIRHKQRMDIIEDLILRKTFGRCDVYEVPKEKLENY